MNQIFEQKFMIFEKFRYRSQPLLKFGPQKFLIRFIEYHLDQLNIKHTKLAVDSTIQFLESHYQNKCLVNV